MVTPSDPVSSPPSPNKGRILIVEDNYIIAASLQERLEAWGYDISGTAGSVEEALRKAVQLRPDLVLMDIRLHGELDGIEAAEFLWDHLRIPVIYVTGHSDDGTLERAKATVPFGYILKPVKGPELDVAIATALNHLQQNERD
jgi:CheY-like chemotaxis protein